ncbi:hypothetical protein HYY74_03435 [Candidatus Woesearchaeota archaeon]|nr:hypothetical protein [Candidatus Woesearchaeota archaeon]
MPEYLISKGYQFATLPVYVGAAEELASRLMGHCFNVDFPGELPPPSIPQFGLLGTALSKVPETGSKVTLRGAYTIRIGYDPADNAMTVELDIGLEGVLLDFARENGYVAKTREQMEAEKANK